MYTVAMMAALTGLPAVEDWKSRSILRSRQVVRERVVEVRQVRQVVQVQQVRQVAFVRQAFVPTVFVPAFHYSAPAFASCCSYCAPAVQFQSHCCSCAPPQTYAAPPPPPSCCGNGGGGLSQVMARLDNLERQVGETRIDIAAMRQMMMAPPRMAPPSEKLSAPKGGEILPHGGR